MNGGRKNLCFYQRRYFSGNVPYAAEKRPPPPEFKALIDAFINRSIMAPPRPRANAMARFIGLIRKNQPVKVPEKSPEQPVKRTGGRKPRQ